MSEGNRPTTRTENRKLPQGAGHIETIDTVICNEIIQSTEEKIEQLAKQILITSISKNHPSAELAEQAVLTARAFYEALEKKE